MEKKALTPYNFCVPWGIFIIDGTNTAVAQGNNFKKTNPDCILRSTAIFVDIASDVFVDIFIMSLVPSKLDCLTHIICWKGFESPTTLYNFQDLDCSQI